MLAEEQRGEAPRCRSAFGCSKHVKGADPRRESKGGASTMSAMLFGLDPKPGELPMARLKPG